MSKTDTSEKLLYLDTSHPFAERVKDLIGRLTLDEKVGMMNHPAQGVPRLNIPAYNYWSEALHGVARSGRATVFPAGDWHGCHLGQGIDPSEWQPPSATRDAPNIMPRCVATDIPINIRD